MLRPLSLPPVLAAVPALLALLALAPGAAQAGVPTGLTGHAAATVAAREPAKDPEPLQVHIETLSPSTVPASGPVRVSGTVTNLDDVTWTTVKLYSFVSRDPMTSRAELAAASDVDVREPVGDRITVPGTDDLVPELAPGDSEPFSLRVPHRYLNADADGVYWFGVHALGQGPAGRDKTADGRDRTFLAKVGPKADPVDTALVISLRHGLLRRDDGALANEDSWKRALGSGGRLRSLVDFGAAAGDRTVNWVLDPALPDAVRELAAGNPPRSLAPNLTPESDGEPSPDGPDPSDPSSTGPSGTAEDGGAAPEPAEPDSADAGDPGDPAEDAPLGASDETVMSAKAWLGRLRQALDGDEILALPYGDTDVAGAAAHDPDLYPLARERSGDEIEPWGYPTTPVISSPTGLVDAEGIGLADRDTTVLATARMDRRQREPPAADELPVVATVAGHRVVLSSSDAASGGPGPEERLSPLALRQRLLAEAAVRAVSGEDTPLVVVLPADWIPGSSAGFFPGLDVDWLNLTSVADATDGTGPPTRLDDLDYPERQAKRELAPANFTAVDRLLTAGTTLDNLLTLNDRVGAEVSDEALGAASYSARRRAFAARTTTDGARDLIEQTLRQVSVDAPVAVTLSSAMGKFTTTISNDLDQPVTVSLSARTDQRLQIKGPSKVEVEAGGRMTLLLTARTAENGVHDVTLVLTDGDGNPLGETDELSIRSAQVSGVIWLFLGAGGALLFGAIAFRLVRRVRAARAAP